MAIRKIIEIDKAKCNACGECIPSCAEHALFIEDNELKIREDKLCDGLGACLNACPKDALKIIEREADEFDHEAVAEFERCNSLKPQTFEAVKTESTQATALQNWPVKLSLVSSKVGFLKNATLSIAADCSAFACSNFHKRYTKDNVMLVGCPRLEDKAQMVDKMAEIFRNAETKQINVLRMEVPCCVIPELVQKAIEKNADIEQPNVQVKIMKSNGMELMARLFSSM